MPSKRTQLLLAIVGPCLGLWFVTIAALVLWENRIRQPLPRLEMPTQAIAAAPAKTWTVHFSPHGGCVQAIVDAIGKARKSIHVQAYSFTSEPIADALIAARQRGVQVSIILDKRANFTEASSQGTRCSKAGIEVRYDGKHPIAHNKVIIIDATTVIGGSYNYTGHAELNGENCPIDRDPERAAAYLANWKIHYEHSEAKR